LLNSSIEDRRWMLRMVHSRFSILNLRSSIFDPQSSIFGLARRGEEFCRSSSCVGGGVGLRQIERERTPLAHGAGHLDLPAEQADHFSANGKAQASPTIFAPAAAFGLLERLENDRELVRGGGDASV